MEKNEDLMNREEMIELFSKAERVAHKYAAEMFIEARTPRASATALGIMLAMLIEAIPNREAEIKESVIGSCDLYTNFLNDNQSHETH